jgi:hypothetical protein
MWGLWQVDDEITLLLDENDVDLFPEEIMSISPQRWRVIKLSGHYETILSILLSVTIVLLQVVPLNTMKLESFQR